MKSLLAFKHGTPHAVTVGLTIAVVGFHRLAKVVLVRAAHFQSIVTSRAIFLLQSSTHDLRRACSNAKSVPRPTPGSTGADVFQCMQSLCGVLHCRLRLTPMIHRPNALSP